MKMVTHYYDGWYSKKNEADLMYRSNLLLLLYRKTSALLELSSLWGACKNKESHILRASYTSYPASSPTPGAGTFIAETRSVSPFTIHDKHPYRNLHSQSLTVITLVSHETNSSQPSQTPPNPPTNSSTSLPPHHHPSHTSPDARTPHPIHPPAELPTTQVPMPPSPETQAARTITQIPQ